jgi:hypothetical protein
VALLFGVGGDVGEEIPTGTKLKKNEHEMVVLFGIIYAIDIRLEGDGELLSDQQEKNTRVGVHLRY